MLKELLVINTVELLFDQNYCLVWKSCLRSVNFY